MIRRTPLLAALGFALATAVVWLLAFHVGAGARLDAAVLDGFTGLSGSRFEPLATAAAGLADPLPFAALAVVLVTIALWRRRPRHALAVVLVLAGANLTTQLLQRLTAAPRPADAPPLAPTYDAWPSGHTTAAMSLALCLVLVAPARMRPLAAAVGGVFAVAEGYGLLVLGWHYPSDVIGAFGVAAAWLALSVALLRVTTASTQAARQHASTVFAPAVATALAGAALVAGVFLVRPARALAYVEAHPAFLVAVAAVGAAGLALAAVAAAVLPSSEDGASGEGRQGPPAARAAAARS